MLQSCLFFAQDNSHSFSHITEEDGLTSNSFNSFVTKDSRGFTWISSMQGIYRYDGSQFKHYTISKNNIFDEVIQSRCFEDSKTNLWFTTYRGLHQYNRLTDTIRNIRLTLDSIPVQSDYHTFHIDNTNHKLWLSVKDQIIEYDIRSETYGSLNSNSKGIRYIVDSLPTGDVNKIFAFPWSLPGFELWEKKGNIWEKEYFENGVLGRSNIKYGLLSDKSTLWLMSQQGLIEFDLNLHKVKEVHIPKGKKGISFMSGVKTKEDCFIISSDNGYGLWEFNFKSKEFQNNWLSHPKVSNSLSSNFPKSLYLDSDQQLWVTQHHKGVDVKFQNQLPFFNPLEKEGQSIVVKSIVEDSLKRIWVLTKGKGVFVFNQKGEKLHHRPLIDGGVDFSRARLNIDQNGYLWIVNKNRIYKNEVTSSNEFGKWDMIYEGQSKDDFYSSFHKIQGKTIFVSTNGIFELINEDGEPKLVRDSVLQGNQSFDFVFKANNKLHIPYKFDRLWILNYNKGIYRKEYDIGINTRIYDIVYSQKHSTTWIATEKGLFRFSNGKLEKVNFNEDGPQSSLKFFGIVEDYNGHLWLSTSDGVLKYFPEKLSLQKFTKSNGLVDNAFFLNAKLIASDSSIWLGSEKGLVVFRPEEINLPKSLASTYIENFSINNKSYRGFPVADELKELTLKYFENTLVFDLRLINYSQFDKTVLQYRMKKYEDNWVTIKDGKGIARFTQIPPGNYLLEIRPVDINNQVGRIKFLKINIPPPFWKTWWFKTLCVLAGIVLVSWLVRFYYKRKLLKQERLLEKQKAINKERDRIAKELHDDMGGGLSSILFLSGDLLDEEKDHDKIVQVERISELTQNALDNMRDIIWALDNEHNSLKDLTMKIRNASLEFLNDYPLRFHFESSIQNIEELEIGSEKKRNILLITKESLHNIVKHAAASNVYIKIGIESNELEINIKDDGKGFELIEKNNQGNGLSNLRKRSEAIQGNLEIQSEVGKGTLIKLNVNLEP